MKFNVRDHGKAIRAFTLIEIMVAITIFAMVMIAIYSTWSAILRGARVAQRAAAQVQRTRIAMETLVTSLSAAEIYADNASNYWFFADTSSKFAELSFVAHLPQSFPGSGLFDDQDVRRVSFSVENGADSKPDLILRQQPFLDEPDSGTKPYSITLARDISFFGMEFWDIRQNDWVPDWPLTNQLPRMIKLAIGFGHEGNSLSSTPADVSYKIVSLPSAFILRDGRTGLGGSLPLQPGLTNVTPGNLRSLPAGQPPGFR